MKQHQHRLTKLHAGFASQSLLTGLGSVQFISNLVFVMLVLKEKVPPRCMLATFFIVVGNVVLVVFGNKASPKYSVAELAALYRKDGMAAYMLMAYAGGDLPLQPCANICRPNGSMLMHILGR